MIVVRSIKTGKAFTLNYNSVRTIIEAVQNGNITNNEPK